MNKWKSRKFLVLVGYVLLTFGTMWVFAWARVSDAAWGAFGTMNIALMGPVMAWVGVEGWLDKGHAGGPGKDPPAG